MDGTFERQCNFFVVDLLFDCHFDNQIGEMKLKDRI